MNFLFTILNITLTVLFIGHQASAEQNSDPCVIDFSQFKSILQSNERFALENEIRDNAKKLLSQNGTLKHEIINLKTGATSDENILIEFQGGGCSHLTFSVKASHFKPPRRAHRFTYKYLEIASFVAENTLKHDLADIFKKALDRAKSNIHRKDKISKLKPKIINLNCGQDVSCRLEILKENEFNLTYSFAI